MTTISVPLPPNLIEFIEQEIKMGNYSNKATLVRKAIAKLQEDALVEAVLKAMKEPSLKGNLRKLAKNL